MSRTLPVSGKAHFPGPRLVITAGVVTTLTAAIGGYLWLRMPDLQPVDFGQSAQISATRSTPATIFASTGLSGPPSCEVTSETGDAVVLGEPERYHQGGGLESVFGFQMTSGTTYDVVCDGAEAGRFAVAQDAAVPEGAFIAAGSLGLAVCGIGGVLAARQRRRG